MPALLQMPILFLAAHLTTRPAFCKSHSRQPPQVPASPAAVWRTVGQPLRSCHTGQQASACWQRTQGTLACRPARTPGIAGLQTAEPPWPSRTHADAHISQGSISHALISAKYRHCHAAGPFQLALQPAASRAASRSLSGSGGRRSRGRRSRGRATSAQMQLSRSEGGKGRLDQGELGLPAAAVLVRGSPQQVTPFSKPWPRNHVVWCAQACWVIWG